MVPARPSSQSRVKVQRAGSDAENGLGSSVFSSEGHRSPKNFEIRLKLHTIQKLELMMHTNTQESTTGLIVEESTVDLAENQEISETFVKL